MVVYGALKVLLIIIVILMIMIQVNHTAIEKKITEELCLTHKVELHARVGQNKHLIHMISIQLITLILVLETIIIVVIHHQVLVVVIDLGVTLRILV